MGHLVLLRSFDVTLIKSSQGVLIGGATWSDCASGRSFCRLLGGHLRAHSRVQMVGHRLEQLKGWRGRDNGQNLGKYISFGMRITSVCLQTEEPVEEGRVCRPWKRRDQRPADRGWPRSQSTRRM